MLFYSLQLQTNNVTVSALLNIHQDIG